MPILDCGLCENCGDPVPGTRYVGRLAYEVCDFCKKILVDRPDLTMWILKVIANKIEEVMYTHVDRYKHEYEDRS